MIHRASVVFALLTCVAGGTLAQGTLAQDALAQQRQGVLRDAEGFVEAGPGRPLVLPADHGSHPETRTEWWYLTGSLQAPDGELFGFQATWFRRALQRTVPPGRSPLAVRDVLLFHGVVLETRAERVHFEEQASRAYGPWAQARTGRLDIRLLGQQLVDETGAGRAARLVLDADGARLELQLDLASSPALLHGELPGLSVKGHEPGQASWYYSLPRITTRGQLRLPGRDDAVEVSGLAWFDHEFGSMQLGADQVGWDWFSVALDDGSDLMLYQLRLDNGRADTTSAGSLRTPDADTRHLTHEMFTITTEGEWTSPTTSTRYPAGWVVEVPGEQLSLRVTPIVADQELQTPATTNVTYWEGLCAFEGTRKERAVRGRGYVELVGYQAPITAGFAPRDP